MNNVKPRAHSDLIKLWADGFDVQAKQCDGKWIACYAPMWMENSEYRIRPAPKPDVVRSFEISKDGTVWLGPTNANIKLTFDGETGKLKSAEVL